VSVVRGLIGLVDDSWLSLSKPAGLCRNQYCPNRFRTSDASQDISSDNIIE